jgi:hypothetical protein
VGPGGRFARLLCFWRCRFKEKKKNTLHVAKC